MNRWTLLLAALAACSNSSLDPLNGQVGTEPGDDGPTTGDTEPTSGGTDGTTDTATSGTTSPTGSSDATSTAADLGGGDLVVTEILQNPAAVDDDAGEWFELHNPTGADIDLDGLELSNDAGTQRVILGSFVVPSGGYAVLGVEADPGLNGGVAVDLIYDGGDFTLGDGVDELILSGPSGEIDAVRWDDGGTFPDPAGASMSLGPAWDDVANDDGASWCEGSVPFGDGDLGTPGAANPACPGATTVPDPTEAPVGVDDLGAGDLVITEILKNPDLVTDDLGEWFELRNVSGVDVDLQGLAVTNLAETQSFVVGTPLVVPAGGYAVLAVNADPATNGGLSVDYGYAIAAFQLANDDDELVLRNAAGILDSVTYDNGVAFPDDSGASMSLDPALLDAASNDLGTSWCSSTSAFGGGDLGTPGAVNDPC